VARRYAITAGAAKISNDVKHSPDPHEVPHENTLSSEGRAAISRSILGVVAFYAATVLVCVILSLTSSHSRAENPGQAFETIASSNVDPRASGMPLP
jgi:hypothetical protein